MSDYGDAVRDMLGEPELVCPDCGEMNSPTHRRIQIDLNANTTCGNCGCGGAVEKFKQLPKEKRT